MKMRIMLSRSDAVGAAASVVATPSPQFAVPSPRRIPQVMGGEGAAASGGEGAAATLPGPRLF